jgi:hypothetical protein
MSRNLIYQVAVGKPSKLYEHCMQSVDDYCKKYHIDYIRQTEPVLMIRPDPFATNRSKEAVERLGYLPIYEKENAFRYFREYDKIVIVDADIYIRPTAPNIFLAFDDCDFAGVVERDMPITEQYLNKIKNYSMMQYGVLKNEINMRWDNRGAEFFNMGLMCMTKSIMKYFRPSETPGQFIMRPEFKDFIDGKGAWKWSTDQTLLNYWIRKEQMNIQKLDWKWNALFTACESVDAAHFIHFFLKDKLPHKGEDIHSLMEQIC